jgi:hypothetical protein
VRIPRIVPPAVCALILVVAVLAAAQTSTAPRLDPPVSATEPMRRGRVGESEAEIQIRERMQRDAERRWNKERQAALKKDTDKLLEMATQLKQQVDKSNENILSLDVIKKADEIEKLAHSVREKMKARSY